MEGGENNEKIKSKIQKTLREGEVQQELVLKCSGHRRRNTTMCHINKHR